MLKIVEKNFQTAQKIGKRFVTNQELFFVFTFASHGTWYAQPNYWACQMLFFLFMHISQQLLKNIVLVDWNGNKKYHRLEAMNTHFYGWVDEKDRPSLLCIGYKAYMVLLHWFRSDPTRDTAWYLQHSFPQPGWSKVGKIGCPWTRKTFKRFGLCRNLIPKQPRYFFSTLWRNVRKFPSPPFQKKTQKQLLVCDKLFSNFLCSLKIFFNNF